MQQASDLHPCSLNPQGFQLCRLGGLGDLAAAGAAWARDPGAARALGANIWAEVLCDSGAWVHVDPLLGWVDTCATPAYVKCTRASSQ